MAAQPLHRFVYLPYEIREMIIEYAATAGSEFFYYKQHLEELRKVDRLFCAVASRELFATCTVYINDSKLIVPKGNGRKRKRGRREKMEKALPFTDFEIFRTKNNNVAHNVRKLIIGCRGSWEHLEGIRDKIESYGKDLMRIYFPLLIRLRRLEFLSLTIAFDILAECESRYLARALLAGLKDYMPPRLDDIYVRHYNVHSSRTPSVDLLPSIMARLRHFKSNLFAHKHWLGPERSKIFHLLGHGERLISVEIHGQTESIFSKKKLPLAPLCPSLVHPDAPLRSFSLCLSTISASRLAGLRHFRKSLRYVGLKVVKLDRGLWDEVFQALSEIEGLTLLGILACGYDSKGSGKDFAHSSGSCGSELYSTRIEDQQALENCFAATKRNRLAIGDE
ncbi:hypothetical protein CBS76997_1814 [Aspergillus niger]|uniref:Inner centromere protein, ARK binding region family protein n=1 Tax=Aspergillus niger TaxID=5061 RepID=A0A254TNY3_ASPNG|nr:hypothetical protein CBS133816_2033 [Aspergillus niger]KAI2851780.1 hypothetical protein CBS11350_987 [Aspergillus niger]KAI2893095.1 hypothetical protein CBS13152_4677 [Aspergillus niger]KAI3035425.1 hypothetical protein CBS147345_565 [Aspergillus niger]KAI3051226.1 hypothetical protein CBS76997_1814 [Aspergillus niger]